MLDHGKYEKVRILITGGLGYLGSRLAYHLLHHGHDVFVGTRKKLKCFKEPLFAAVPVQMDWNNTYSLESSAKGMDTVIHAAGMDAQACSANPVKALEVNGLNTAMMVEAAIANKVQRFIYLSTAHVYRSPMIGDIDESTPSTNLHPYATSKLAGEKPILYATQMGKIQGVVLRLSNGSGHPVFPDTKCWHLILNDLCRQSVEKRELILHSENSIERNFISMNDVCLGIEHFLQLSEKYLDDSPFNLCSGKSHSLQQLACLITTRCKTVLGYAPELKPSNQDGENNSKRRLNLCTQKIEKTGLTLQANIEQEIDKTLLFCKKNFYLEN
jgi:UDP-glucose 4-epimerase